ncbi:MAG: PTS N-acetylgalactosamine transporter subunit IID [Sporolactobacillus sp.]|jgi:PTS system galactosamine-specific IID component|nr:PTS N-acetylgalactosamine transporter subunit IID [Sporolactobacillus sp.]
MESNRGQLTKHDIDKLAIRSIFNQTAFNYERMQSAGWLYSMLPGLKKIYQKDKAGLSQAMKDNLEFMNTNNNTAPFLMAMLLSLEEHGEKRSTINGLRVALFGPLAGIGDAIFWFTILPIVAGVTASFCKQGSLIGPIVFFLVYVGIFFLRIFWARLGYFTGTKAITKIRENSAIIARAAGILGVTVIGGLIATYVDIQLVAKFTVTAGHSISLQKDFLDKIFPNILPLGYTFLMYWFLKAKNTNPVILIAATFIFAIVFSYLGVL